MRSRFSIAMYVILALFVIGVLSSLLRNPGQFLLPVILFAVIFYLYKFPPTWLRQMVHRGRGGGRYTPPPPPKRTKAKSTKRSKSPFRVISGNKRDSEDEPPRYH